ncbi:MULTISPECIES: SET domain-containing protein [unclassified Sphingomonas]|jgi:hypothetical protein|uniref:SET domain-containing protein n=1 Tax=unclassified Sphingomonas TaxID=196159 RepID=UPI0006F3C6DB|nr:MULTISPECIES: SET domain-containing protein-lysine N-methyltransferase [unclassified Sphingomonas]KQN29353.1 lysine methyltransferase [Sphingomonas sp. Leaf38]KQN31453.1 lysine methyltransferase [Sphingomonas sp. Leaf34]
MVHRAFTFRSGETGDRAIELWFIIAMGLSAAGYTLYLAGLQRHLVEPNRASWLIWSAATGIEAATYAAVNPNAPQSWIFGLSALACAVVTLVMWRRSRWRAPTPSETACMAAAFAAILLWVAFHETFWAHMLVVAAVPISFWPTWQSVWEDRARERSPAWGLWTLGDLATLLLATRTHGSGVGEYGYILVELLCHASVWFMVGLATINPVRSFGLRRGRFFILDAYRPAANLFAVGETHLGKAVYAAAGFAQGETVIRFSGRRVGADRVPALMQGTDDRFVQITADSFMGPSGRIDDLINHSCAPNTGLRFGDDGVILIALRDIAPGEEIAWDYSTTLSLPAWRMPCACGSAACRGTIGGFETLPIERQRWFLERDMVAPYLRDVTPDVRAA